MKIDVFNVEEFIDLNNLEEVTSPILFQRGSVPDPYGLISNDIFGVNVKTRRRTFAYIKLHGHFFNPHIYKAFTRLWRNIDKIINGDFFYNIDENGYLYRDDENGRTGMESIYKDWNKIRWERSEDASGMRNANIDLLTKTPKNQIFMEYQIVIPAFYRDVMPTSNGGGETSELNNLYSKLIRLAGLLEDGDMYAFTLHSTYYNMQHVIVDIYDYFKKKLEKKNGLIRKYLMGKNTDYCTRSVISPPLFHADRPEALETDFEHVGIPISQVCSLCYPFVQAYIKNWFENEFIVNQESKILYDKKGEEGVVRLLRPESYFTDDYIKKMCNRYIRDPEYRFKPIEVPLDNGKMGKIAHTGIRYGDEVTEQSTISTRPMTVTDLLYMACVDATKDKHCMVTRYPVSDSYGVFLGKIRVISTLQTEPMKVGETVYPFYPKIEIGLSEKDIATRFKETVIFSSAYLDGINGDFDGDQVTIKVLYTQEANAEIAAAIRNPSFFITPTGSNIRKCGKEGLQTLYALTKKPNKNSKRLTPGEVEMFVSLPAKQYTYTFFTETFADKYDTKAKKRVPSKYNPNDIVVLEKGMYFNTERVETTLGRLFFNKIIVDDCGLKDLIGYMNDELVASKTKAFEGKIATAITDGVYSTEKMIQYLNHRDWVAYQFYATLCASFTERTLVMPKAVKELKMQLAEKYQKEIEAGDPAIAEKIEKELIALTEKILDDDPGMDFFKSDSKLSTGNNLKNIVLMRGAIFNPITGEYDIVMNSLLEGMEKGKFAAHSNALILGAFPKACGTADSGYLSKQLSAAMQTEIIDENPASDCGTDKTLTIEITDKNKNDYTYRNMKTGDGYVMLTPKAISQYVGKKVKLFSPMYCTGDHICRKCAGGYGNRFIGLDTNKVATTLTNLNMKKFHDNTIHIQTLKPNELLILNRKANVLGSDGKNIICNEKYLEFYIPEFYFATSYRFAEDLGDKYNVFGVFNVGIFNNDKMGYMDTMKCPGNIMLNVYDMERRKVYLPGLGTTDCRVIKYYEKNEIMKNFLIEDSENAQTFLRSVIYGKLPNSIPYSSALDIWMKNQGMNGVNFGVPSIILEVILRVSYRDKDNVARPFAKAIGMPNSKLTDYDYKMASVRQICQFASTFSAITFEDFTYSVTSSINRKHDKKPENESPVEELFKM